MIVLVNNCIFCNKECVIPGESCNEYAYKTDKLKGRDGLENADKGGRGVVEMLTLADRGRGRLGSGPPPFLGDIICGQHISLNTKLVD